MEFLKQFNQKRFVSRHFTRHQKTKMKTFNSIIGILFLLSTICCSDVLNLTSENFNSTIAQNKYVMVKFYAPWCAHCKTMIPEYERLAELLKDEGIVIGQVDATVEDKIAEVYKVEGFPSMKFFISGQVVDYAGTRTADAMHRWITKVMTTEFKQLSEEQVNSLREKGNFLVYYGNDSQQSQKLLRLLSIIDPSLNYYTSPSRDGQQIVLYIKNKYPVQYPTLNEISASKLGQWVMMNSLPTIIPLSTKERLDYVFYQKSSQKDAAMLLRESDLSEEAFKRLQEICDMNKDRLKCCMVDDSMDIYLGVKNYVRSKGESVLVITRDTLKQAYRYPLSLQQLAPSTWNTFLQQITQSKYKNLADIESDVVEYQHAKILTDQNYTSFIEENDLVLVEFVSPGCAQCVEFQDEFDAMAKEVYSQEGLELEVAAIDLKRNKVMGYQLKIVDFPSFRLYLDGAYVDYQGKPNRTEILSFVAKINSTNLIPVNSIQEVPSEAVIVYDPSEVSQLRILPAIFTRYPVYHIRQGDQPKIILKTEEYDDKTYPADRNLTVSQISKWLFIESDPILVNMLAANMAGKLSDAITRQVLLLGLIDAQPELSSRLRKTLETYCRNSSVVCGFAKKGEENFGNLMDWVMVDKDISTSNIFVVDTSTAVFQKFLYNQNIQELTVESIQQFVSDVKEGKIISTQKSSFKKQKETPKFEATEEEAQAKESEQTERTQAQQNEDKNQQL